MAPPTGPRLAVNPIPYWLSGTTDTKSTANLGRACEELASIGYTAIKADVPSDMQPQGYLSWLESFGLAPALSLFSGSFTDPATHRQVAEDARRFTGHMSWAGMDVAAVLADYAPRIVGVHLKDTFRNGIERAKAEDLDYVTATRPGGIWAEPGTGQLDLVGCVRAFPADFAGDYMIEVDVPTVPLKECHQIAYDWAVANLPIGG